MYKHGAVEETDISPLCPEFDNSITSSLTINKPKLRPPLPPPKKPLSSSPPPMIEEAFYEDPQLIMNRPTKFEDSVEEVYDNIDEANAIREMNKFPPPVWKQGDGLQPPPLPPSHPTRRYTRSFDQSSEFVNVDEWKAPKLPKARSKKPTTESPKRKKHFGSLKDSPRMPKNKIKTKPPLPPAKPWKAGSSDDLLSTNSSELLGGERGGGGHGATIGRGMGFNLKNDPKFGRKLQERRQEIYGGTTERSRPRSWGHDQEEYEEVAFTASDDDLLDGRGGAGGRSADLSCSDEEYVDCEPHDDDAPAMYMEHNSTLETRRVGGKGPNTLKREEFLKRPPLPLPSHSSAGNPIPKSPPKVPAGGRPKVGGGAPFVRPPMASMGFDPPPPLPRHGNERPPMPLPGAVVDDKDDEDEAPPVPRRHPHASDKHRILNVGDSSSPSSSWGTENAISLPHRSVSPSTPPYPSPTSNSNAPPLPQRGPRQFDSPSPLPTAPNQPKNKKVKAPPPIIRKQRSLSPEDLASPASARSDHVFEPFTFGQGPPSIPHTLPQTNKSNRAKFNLPVPVKNPASRSNYETDLPADIGMKLAKKKIASYEVNLPPSIGNRPPLHTTRPETASAASSDTRPRPPIKPPVAVKPTQPKSPPHVPVKPQVSKKPATATATGGHPTMHPKPPIITPKPAAVGTTTTNLASRTNFINKGGSVANSTTPGRTFNSDASYNTQPVTASKPVRTRNGASKPPAPPGKPKSLLPPTVDRRKQLSTPSY